MWKLDSCGIANDLLILKNQSTQTDLRHGTYPSI